MKRDKLVKMVKAMGQEMIDRAEDLVGDGEMISDFDIWLRFPVSIDGDIPEIEVTRKHISKNVIKMMMDKDE